MNMKTISKLILVSFVLTLAIGCKDRSGSTTTGNPFVSFGMTSSSSVATVAKKLWQQLWVQMFSSAHALPPPGTMMDSATNTVVINNIWLTVGEVEFKSDEIAGGTEVDGSDIDFVGPYSIDMLEVNPPPLVSGRISVNALRRVKVKLVRTTILPTGAPAGFSNNSIFIAGTVNGFNFSYTTQDETVLEIAGPNLIAAVENSNLLLELRIANLIKRINLSAINANTAINDGNRIPVANACPNIDVSAADLFTCFRKGLQTESTIGRDDDGDDQLDVGEDSVD